MGTIECSQPASKSSWDSQDFGDISMVLKMAHFRKSTGPRWVNGYTASSEIMYELCDSWICIINIISLQLILNYSTWPYIWDWFNANQQNRQCMANND